MSKIDARVAGLPFEGPSEWRNEFAEELIRLAPRLNPDAADEFSDSQFLISGNLEPIPAASAFASRNGYLPEAAGPTPTHELITPRH